MIVHRFTAPADQQPVVDWLKSNTDKAHADTIARSISSLKTGEAWVVSGEAKLLERRQFPRISTYDNSATPTYDGKQKEVKTAAVDGDKLRAIIGDAVKEAEANDPAKLKAKIAELEREAKKKATEPVFPGKPVVNDRMMAAAQDAGRQIGFQDGYAACAQKIAGIVTALPSAIAAAVETPVQRIFTELRKPAPKAPPAAAPVRADPAVPRGEVHFVQGGRQVGKIVNLTTQNGDGNGELAPSERRILNALASFEQLGMTPVVRVNVAFFAGYTENGHFNNMCGRLRTAGYIDYPGGGQLALTDSGREHADAGAHPIATLEQLHDRWLGKLSPSESKLLKVLIEAYPESVTRADLAERTGYTENGHFNNMLGHLRTLGAVSYPAGGQVAATSVLFPEGLA